MPGKGYNVIGLRSPTCCGFGIFGMGITVPCFQAFGKVPLYIDLFKKCMIYDLKAPDILRLLVETVWKADENWSRYQRKKATCRNLCCKPISYFSKINVPLKHDNCRILVNIRNLINYYNYSKLLLVLIDCFLESLSLSLITPPPPSPRVAWSAVDSEMPVKSLLQHISTALPGPLASASGSVWVAASVAYGR